MAINPSDVRADSQELAYRQVEQTLSFDPQEGDGIDRLRFEAFGQPPAAAASIEEDIQTAVIADASSAGGDVNATVADNGDVQSWEASNIDDGSYLEAAGHIGTGLVNEIVENPGGLVVSGAVGVGAAAAATVGVGIVAAGTAPVWVTGLIIAGLAGAAAYGVSKAYGAISSMVDDAEVVANKSDHTAAEVKEAEEGLEDFGAGSAHVAASMVGAPVGVLAGSAVKAPIAQAVARAFSGPGSAAEGALVAEAGGVLASEGAAVGATEATVAGASEVATGTGIGSKIAAGVSNLSNRAAVYAEKAWEVGGKGFDSLKSASARLTDGVYDLGARAAGATVSLAGRFAPEVQTIATSVGQTVSRVAGQATEGVKHYAGPHISEARTWVAARSEPLSNAWSGTAEKVGSIYGDKVVPFLGNARDVTVSYGGKAYELARDNAYVPRDYVMSYADRLGVTRGVSGAFSHAGQLADDAYFAIYPRVSEAYSVARPYVDDAGRYVISFADQGKHYVAVAGDGMSSYAARVSEAIRPRVVNAGERASELASEARLQLASRSQNLRDRMQNLDQYLAYDIDDLGTLGIMVPVNMGNQQTYSRV